MQKLIWCQLLAILTLAALFGCATYPPPEILPDKATNFKYQYSVDIPKGWDVNERLPKDLEKSFPQSFKKLVTLVMLNKSSRGVIAIANDKRSKDFQKVLNTPEDKIYEVPQMIEEKGKKRDQFSRFSSQVYIESLAATYRNYRANSSSFKSEALYEMEVGLESSLFEGTACFDWFIYPCHRTKFCQTVVILMCGKDKFESNHQAFESVVKSLTMHDVPGS